MNIVIVGCGNVGFEAAKLLAENNSILLIDRYRPKYLTELLEKEENVFFALGDATDVSVPISPRTPSELNLNTNLDLPIAAPSRRKH